MDMHAVAESDELGLGDFLLLVWGARSLVVICVTVGAIAAGIAAFLLPNEFEATVVMLPVQSNKASGGLGDVASQMGGLASLVGLPSGGDSKKAEALGILQSQNLAERYIEANQLEDILFGDRPGEHKHSVWRAWAKFDKIRKVNDDKKSGLVSLKITWRDPVLAAKWANDLVQLTNDDLRSKAISEAERHIEYLTQQAANTDIAQVRNATYSILETEIKNLMLAKGPGDFALKVVDRAVPPERKSGPFRSLWILLGGIGGMFLASVILVLRRNLAINYRATSQPV